MDTVSSSQRAKIMARVKSSGNKSTESIVLAAFREKGISGWRRQYPVFGTPDFCFPRQRIAVFVDGCFWHGCPRHCRKPSTNQDYWERKIASNAKRDRTVASTLRKKGWTVVRIWEHETSDPRALARKITRIKKIVQQDKSSVRGKPRR